MRYVHALMLALAMFMSATVSFAVDRNKFPDLWERLNYGWYNPDTDTLNGDLAYEAPQEYFDKCKAALIHGISLYNHKRLEPSGSGSVVGVCRDCQRRSRRSIVGLCYLLCVGRGNRLLQEQGEIAMGIVWLYVIGLCVAGFVVIKFMPEDKKPAAQ